MFRPISTPFIHCTINGILNGRDLSSAVLRHYAWALFLLPVIGSNLHYKL